jgi:hypothetical protein
MTQDERRQLSKAVAGTIAVITGLLIAPALAVAATIGYFAGREALTQDVMPKPAAEDEA